MKRLIIFVLTICLIFFIVVPVLADNNKWMPLKLHENDWSQKDTTIQTAVALFIMADWAQTRYIASNPSTYAETNPILGSHPAINDVDQYFAVCLIGNTVIAYILPKDLRKWWQAISLSMEIGYVNQNYNLGVKIKL